MGETVRKWQEDKHSLSFPECTKNPNYTPKIQISQKQEVQKEVSNFPESVTLSKPASPLCIRWYFTLQSIINHQHIEKARPQPQSPCEVENRECLTPSQQSLMRGLPAGLSSPQV